MVQVGSTPITKSTFEPLAGRGGFAPSAQTARRPRRRPSRSCPTRPPTRPASRICRRRRRSPRRAPGPTPAQLKSQCEQQYTALKQQVLGFLISANWVIGEASDQGISVIRQGSRKEVQANSKKQQFPKEADFQKFLDEHGTDGLRPAAAREAEPALAEDPAEDRQEKARRRHPAQIEKYYNENKRVSGSPKRAISS